MSRHRMTVRSHVIERVSRSQRPEASLGAHAFTTATDHPFEPDGVAPACADADPELFWPATVEQAQQARLVCGPCPLREACLSVAVRRGEWGVWGGELLAKGKPSAELPGNVRPPLQGDVRSA